MRELSIYRTVCLIHILHNLRAACRLFTFRRSNDIEGIGYWTGTLSLTPLALLAMWKCFITLSVVSVVSIRTGQAGEKL